MKTRLRFGLLAVACGAPNCAMVLRAEIAGSVDLSYAPLIGAPGSFARVSAAMPQPDGKLVVAGAFNQVQGLARNNVVRLLPNGSLESAATFTHDLPTSGFPMKATVQSDGRILVVVPAGLVRLESNGSRESTATFTGPVVHYSNGNPATIYGISLQPDGKIIICGNFARVNGRDLAGVARLLPNGSVEGISEFNPGGGLSNGWIQCTAAQADGKILVGGGFITIGGQARRSIARLLPDGAVESTATFHATVEYENGNAGLVWAIVVQPDGRILVAGQFQRVNGQPRGGIARLLADGSLDDTFHPGITSIVLAMALQADGKILTGSPLAAERLARLLPDGARESATTFERGTGPWAAISADFSSLTLQTDGKILVGGTLDNVNGTPVTNLARLHNDPATQRLAATTDKIHWLRGGTAPEVHQVTFEHAPTGGAPWTMLGSGIRVAGAWELSGISVPAMGLIRARGRTVGGQHNGSQGLIENILDLEAVLRITGFTVSPAPASENGRRIALTAEGGSGAASAIMELQASESLGEWDTVATAIADSGGRAVFDYEDAGGTWRWFRARLP